MYRVRSRPDFNFDTAAYRDLFAVSAATPFQHPVWLDVFYRVLAPRFGAEPQVVTVEDGDGRLVLVLPLLRRRRRGLRFVESADLGVSDYAAPVCRPADYDRVCADPAALAQIRRVLGPYDVLRVTKQRRDSPDISRLLPRSTKLAMSGHAHEVGLAEPYDTWREAHVDRTSRREFDKKRRKLDRLAPWTVERATDPVQMPAAFADALEMRKPRFVGRERPDVLADAAAMGFYVEVARAGAASGFARTYLMRLSGETIAFLFGLAHAGRFCVVLSAFDADYKSYSLGNILFEEVIADCIRSQDQVFDLTIGDEAYKQRFGAVSHDLSTVMKAASVVGVAAKLMLAHKWGVEIAKGLTTG